MHAGDCGVFSDWQPMYEPSTVKADADRLAAFRKGVPRARTPPAPFQYRAVGKSFVGEAERLRRSTRARRFYAC